MIAPDLLPFKNHPEFDDPEAVSRILQYQFNEATDTAKSQDKGNFGLASFNINISKIGVLLPNVEVNLFKKLNLLKKLINENNAPHDALKQIVEIRSIIVKHNLKLIIYIYHLRYKCDRDVPFERLLSDGTMALYKSVESFDISLNNKFSSYACVSILRCIRHDGKRMLYTNKDIAEPYIDSSIEEFHDDQHNKYVLYDLFTSGVLNDREIEFMKLRNDRAMTLLAIATDKGLSKERVRQILEAAYAKARDYLMIRSKTYGHNR